jgi:glutamyl-tRNA synthetase
VTETSARPVRVRFAPSPTGSLHIGGLRTALFNWLFARHHNGVFILRIEDTDQKRYDPEALRILTESLRWAGLNWDEGPEVGGAFGPYVQSERLALYQQWAGWLVEHGHAYPAYETPEELDAMRKEQEARGDSRRGYNRAHRDLTPEQRAAFEAEGRPKVIRLKMPLDGETAIDDAIQGRVTFDNSVLQDMVLLKADGFPTYHLAHVVDDHLMQISHVIRAVEWQSSLPIHWQLWQAFGWEPPVYAHVPVMLNPNGKGKMSKRNPPKDAQGRVVPVLVHDYIEAGYLPEAVINFLTNNSWHFGDDREVYTPAEAIARFDLSGINPTNAAHQPDKLDWYNGQYIRALDPDDLAERLLPVMARAGYPAERTLLRAVAPLVQERLKRLSADEVMEFAGFLFRPTFIPASRALLLKGFRGEPAAAAEMLRAAADVLASVEPFDRDGVETALRGLVEAAGLKAKEVFGLVRAAVTGQEVSTPLFETLAIIGQAACVERLQSAAQTAETDA